MKSTAPVNPMIASAQTPSREQLKDDLEKTLNIARHSSASLGKFDNKLPDEKKLPHGRRKVRTLLPMIGDVPMELTCAPPFFLV